MVKTIGIVFLKVLFVIFVFLFGMFIGVAFFPDVYYVKAFIFSIFISIVAIYFMNKGRRKKHLAPGEYVVKPEGKSLSK